MLSGCTVGPDFQIPSVPDVAGYLPSMSAARVTPAERTTGAQGAAFVHGVDNATEVVVEKNDIASIFGDLGAASHGDADMCITQRRYVVDAIPCHGGDIVLFEK